MNEDEANADEEKKPMTTEEMNEFIRNLPGPGNDMERFQRYSEAQRKKYSEEMKAKYGTTFEEKDFTERLEGLGAIAIFSAGRRPLSSFKYEGFEKAEQYYTHLLDTYPSVLAKDDEYYSLQYFRGLAKHLNGNYEGAINDLQESSRHMKCGDDALDIGFYFVLRDRNKAKEILDRLFNKYPECVCLYRRKLGLTPELNKALKHAHKTLDLRKCPSIIVDVCSQMDSINIHLRFQKGFSSGT